jgi:hypothetical protein
MGWVSLVLLIALLSGSLYSMDALTELIRVKFPNFWQLEMYVLFVSPLAAFPPVNKVTRCNVQRGTQLA